MMPQLLGHCCVASEAAEWTGTRSECRSDRSGEFGERVLDTPVRSCAYAEFVVGFEPPRGSVRNAV